MKVNLRVKKKGTVLDEDSFGAAFSRVWRNVRQKRLDATTSVGELMEIINDEVLDQLQGAEISIEKVGSRSN